MPKDMYEILIRYFFAINYIEGRLYGSAEMIRKQENEVLKQDTGETYFPNAPVCICVWNLEVSIFYVFL